MIFGGDGKEGKRFKKGGKRNEQEKKREKTRGYFGEDTTKKLRSRNPGRCTQNREGENGERVKVGGKGREENRPKEEGKRRK